jgi:hypothetical protein
MHTMSSPIICFGQQPCGFFPKRFLVAKIETARKLQSEIGGAIVFFYHDSDHDPRETRTVLRHRKTQAPAQLNFTFEDKLQRKFSPLYAKRIPAGWHEKTESQLPNYIDHPLIDIFKKTNAANVADFCLEMYRQMGLLEGITVMRSGDAVFRGRACDISDFFVDVEYEGETVRARFEKEALKLHEGGDEFIQLPMRDFSKEQISPSRDSRLSWMQSVVHCTHYVAGLSEQDYLNKADAPEINFMTRDNIEQADEAYIELP